MQTGILAGLRANLPVQAGCAQTDPCVRHQLWAGELLPGATPARLAEFSAGRAAARAALKELDVTPCALVAGMDRVPCWPAGFVGSITHTSEFCLAAVLPKPTFQGIGIDLEPATSLETSVWTVVLRPEEITSTLLASEKTQGLVAKQIFVAKEAAFKAQYCLTRASFSFDRLSVVLRDNRFDAFFTADTHHFKAGDNVSGQIEQFCGQFLATVVI